MLDEKDMRILRELMLDSSRSYSELSGILNMPRTTIQERVRRMREHGVIRKFTVVPDYSKLGKPTTAFVLVSFLPTLGVSQKEVANRISKMEDVYEVHLIAGEWDILLKVRGKSMQEIGELVIDKLRAMEGIGRTYTCASFLTLKEEV